MDKEEIRKLLPLRVYPYDFLMASELVLRLQQMIKEHGDGPVFSYADWEYVTDVCWEEADPDTIGPRTFAGIRLG